MKERKTAVIKIAIPFVTEESPNMKGLRIVGDRPARMNYLDALSLEAESVAGDFEDCLIKAISVEGPMPSIMSPDGLGGLLRRISALFDVDPACEIALAAVPHTVGVPSLTGWGQGKVNRISLKAGSLQAAELSSLGASYGLSDIQNALLFFDKFHMRNVDVELLVGIPGQSESSLMRSIRSLASIDVPHVTLKPFEADGALDLSSERVLFDRACERLASEGYSHYSPGRFARKAAYESALVRGIARGSYVIGMGLGALTVGDDFACRNTTDYAQYVSAPDDPRAAVEKTVLIDEAHASSLEAGRVLMLPGGLATSSSNKRVEGKGRIFAELSAMEQRGLVFHQGDSWGLTKEGLFSWVFGQGASSITEAVDLLG